MYTNIGQFYNFSMEALVSLWHWTWVMDVCKRTENLYALDPPHVNGTGNKGNICFFVH